MKNIADSEKMISKFDTSPKVLKIFKRAWHGHYGNQKSSAEKKMWLIFLPFVEKNRPSYNKNCRVIINGEIWFLLSNACGALKNFQKNTINLTKKCAK